MHGGRIYEIAKMLQVPREEILDFSASVNPFGMDPGLQEELERALKDLVYYPDIHMLGLEEKIGQKHGLLPEEVFLGNGANSILYRLYGFFARKKMLLPVPSFETYEKAAKAWGIEVSHYFLKDWRIQEDFLEGLQENVGLVTLCNPNNPTGMLAEPGILMKIVRKCREHHIFVLMDECFLSMVPEGEKYSLIPLLFKNPHVGVLCSFTKIFSIPGLRLGYFLCSSREIMGFLHSTTPDWDVNTLALAAGAYCIKQSPQGMVQTLDQERCLLSKRLEAMGIRVFPSRANFLLCYFKENLYQPLLQKKIIIRDCSDFLGLGPGFFRVAVRRREENLRLCQVLERIIKGENG